MPSVPTVVVDRQRSDPAYEQIAEQIRTGIAAGALPPGSTLPSVRTLAADLGVNLNTVARAYRVLAEEGFVVVRARAGVVVAAPAAEASAQARAALGAELHALLVRMRQAGWQADAIRAFVDSELTGRSGRRIESEG